MVNLNFKSIDSQNADWLESAFIEKEVKDDIFDLGGDKALGLDDFPMFLSRIFRGMSCAFYLGLMRGVLSNEMGASFIASILEKVGAEVIRDFCPIHLVGSVYKIVAKVLAKRIKSVMPSIISKAQAAFVMGEESLDGVSVTNECLHLRLKDKKPGLICKFLKKLLM